MKAFEFEIICHLFCFFVVSQFQFYKYYSDELFTLLSYFGHTEGYHYLLPSTPLITTNFYWLSSHLHLRQIVNTPSSILISSNMQTFEGVSFRGNLSINSSYIHMYRYKHVPSPYRQMKRISVPIVGALPLLLVNQESRKLELRSALRSIEAIPLAYRTSDRKRKTTHTKCIESPSGKLNPSDGGPNRRRNPTTLVRRNFIPSEVQLITVDRTTRRGVDDNLQ